MARRAKNSIYGPSINWYDPSTVWNTIMCGIFGHPMDPWKNRDRKRDERWCNRCKAFGEWRFGWLTNEQYHETEVRNIRP